MAIIKNGQSVSDSSYEDDFNEFLIYPTCTVL
jgi:hypothetical protein